MAGIEPAAAWEGKQSRLGLAGEVVAVGALAHVAIMVCVVPASRVPFQTAVAA